MLHPIFMRCVVIAGIRDSRIGVPPRCIVFVQAGNAEAALRGLT